METSKERTRVMQAAALLMMLASIYFLVQIMSSIKEYRFIGAGAGEMSTISFSGSGEVSAAPDLATISFTIREEAKELSPAQDEVAKKEKIVLDFLDEQGIAKKDIKTESYNSYPKYDYGKPCYYSGIPCEREEPKIIGYEVSEYISVKVRDLEQVGEIVKGIGGVGVSEINGPSFSIEDEDELKAEARKMAIDEAKTKAKELSKDLGVDLVRIVNFSEDGNYPRTMYALDAMAKVEGMGGDEEIAPGLPTGENTITSNVVITYEIR